MNHQPRHRSKKLQPNAVLLAAAAWVDPYDPLHPLEEQFRQAARDVAKRLGWTCFHQRDSRGSDAGWLDETWIRPPRVLFVELKAPDGRYSEAQRDTIALLQRCPGVEVYAIRSTGDRARDQASIAQLLSPHARPAGIVPRETKAEGHL